MNQFRNIMVMVLMAVILFGCAKNNKVETPNSGTPLSDSELKGFISATNITPLDVKNLKTSTIILFQKDNKSGFYVLTSKQGKVETISNAIETESGTISPISTEYHSVSQDVTPFATFILNDMALQKKAFKIRATFLGNFVAEELVNGRHGIIILNEKDLDQTSELQSTTVFDRGGNVILNS